MGGVCILSLIHTACNRRLPGKAATKRDGHSLTHPTLAGYLLRMKREFRASMIREGSTGEDRLRLVILVVLVSFSIVSLGLLQGANAEPLRPQSWLYLLQDADINSVVRAGFDLVVMDYSRDGSDEERYTREEIEEITAAGTIPVCYLSIGEAEDYRFYWDPSWTEDPPAFLGRTNPDWEGNYKVRYWDEGWQKIVSSYLDRILAQGFSGVYLDIIDAFEYWSKAENGEDFCLPEEEAASRMITFVLRIADYCRVENDRPDFLIFPQNGEQILTYDPDGAFLAAISGIGVEDLWYDETDPQSSEETAYRLSLLERIAVSGKVVLSIDYVDDGTGYRGANLARIRDYIGKARAAGFIPYAARCDRALDRIIRIPGLQPQ